MGKGGGGSEISQAAEDTYKRASRAKEKCQSRSNVRCVPKMSESSNKHLIAKQIAPANYLDLIKITPQYSVLFTLLWLVACLYTSVLYFLYPKHTGLTPKLQRSKFFKPRHLQQPHL
jgi:hypothetical protein